MPTFNTSNPLPMSDQAPASYTPAACWCRNCDHAAKAGLSPLAALQLGSRFIVCPDCGNKRCPKGTNHELACANSNAPGQIGSEWENVKPAASTPAPALLSLSQLDALAHALEEERQGCAAEPASPLGYWPTAVAALLGHVEVLSAQRHALQGMDQDEALRPYAVDEVMQYLHKRRGNEFLASAERLLSERYAAIAALTARALKAEARVKEQQAELAEQEVGKLELVRQIFTRPI